MLLCLNRTLHKKNTWNSNNGIPGIFFGKGRRFYRGFGEGYIVHHINENKLDARKENLALVPFTTHQHYHKDEKNPNIVITFIEISIRYIHMFLALLPSVSR